MELHTASAYSSYTVGWPSSMIRAVLTGQCNLLNAVFIRQLLCPAAICMQSCVYHCFDIFEKRNFWRKKL